jgi:hypothetical protein
MKLAEKGAIQAAQAVPVIIDGMNAKFGGLMENFSKTVMGQWSNFQDQIGFILGDIGKSLMPLLTDIMEQFVLPAGEAIKTLAEAFADLPGPIRNVAVVVAALAAAVGPLLILLGGLAFSFAGLAPLLGTAGLAGVFSTLIPILGVRVIDKCANTFGAGGLDSN